MRPDRSFLCNRKRRVTDPKQRQKRRAKLREKYLKSLADKGKRMDA
jgi:hypothetical protein